MHPYFYFGDTAVPAYGIMVISALILGVFIAVIRAGKYGLSRLNVIIASIFIVIGLLFGSKILFAITTIPEVLSHIELLKTYPIETIIYMFSGFVFFGGFLGGLLFLKMFTFQFNQPFWKYISLFIPMVPLMHAIGRVGCFLGGCCYGIEYHGLLSVTYPDDAIVEGVNLFSRFPVQLFEAGLNLILFVVLIIYTNKPRRDGNVLGLYLIFYSVIRFFVEFLRDDTLRGIFLGLSTSQWISIALLVFGVYLIKRKKK